MRYWWVNHNQTARQEIDGQYLWSPKTRQDGARNRFYENLRRADPGDLVLSYAGQAIRYVGRVASFAFTAAKPTEFGSVGAYWNDEGWFLPVFWVPLATPVQPRSIFDRLGPLLPRQHGPIHPVTGRGYQHAYLAEIDRAVVAAVLAGVAHDESALGHGGSNSLSYEAVAERLDDVVARAIEVDESLNATERESLIRARRGQGAFRRNVESVEQSCRLTGITNRELLIASHIKPWRNCASSQERLDGMNGLLLTPDADHLFDRGYVSFEDDGRVCISDRVDREDLRRLGFEDLAWQRFGVAEAPAVWNTGTFRPKQREYLAHHRREVFLRTVPT